MNQNDYKVAYVIDGLSYGGAAKQLTLLLRALPPRFHPVVICMSEQTHPFADILCDEGFEVTALSRRFHVDATRLVRLARALRVARVDLVHGFLDASNVYAFLAARMLRKPIILHVQNEQLQLHGLRRRVLSWMLRHADRVMVNSRAGERFLLNSVGVPERALVLIQNWIAAGEAPLDPCDRASDRPAELVGFIGRFTDQKRLPLLIEAFRVVAGLRPDARLVMMGAGSEKTALEQLSARLGIDERVEFRPASPDVESTLRELSCLVLPSAYEGLPNVAIEALLQGVPVVASRAGDMPELLTDGQTGLLVEGDAPEALARAIVRVLSDSSLAENARIEGPKLVKERFSLDIALEKLVPVYQRLLNGLEKEKGRR
jgi:glycosyltransferase involved in cell wall biosynthesis